MSTTTRFFDALGREFVVGASARPTPSITVIRYDNNGDPTRRLEVTGIPQGCLVSVVQDEDWDDINLLAMVHNQSGHRMNVALTLACEGKQFEIQPDCVCMFRAVWNLA